MRKANFVCQTQFAPATDPEAGGRPFSDAVESQDLRFIEWGGKEGACGMRLVVIGEDESSGVLSPEPFADLARQMQLLFEPQGNRLAKRSITGRRIRKVRLEQPLKF